MPKWTNEQKKIIEHEGGCLLVSAAAGSGKTAVLVEHIISNVLKGVPLSSMLVMTFTEAAAGEMKERIKESLENKLKENPGDRRLIRELSSIQNAPISTIHAFCKDVISKNYALIDLDPSFRIANEAELTLIKADIIEGILEERFDEGEESFISFVDDFSGGKDDRGIDELILLLYNYVAENPWPDMWIKNVKEECKESASELKDGKMDKSLRYLFSQYIFELESYVDSLDMAIEYANEGPVEYIEDLEEERESILEFSSAHDIFELEKMMRGFKFARIKSSKCKNIYKDLAKSIRDNVKAGVEQIVDDLMILSDDIKDEMIEGNKESILTLISLLEEFIEKFSEEKTSLHILDFSDLQHKAIEILYEKDEEHYIPSAVADKYASRFKEVLVDEYQDSNYLQEAIINAVSSNRTGKGNTFEVGDVKQSIYGFRLARPEIFISKYNDPTYPLIELSKNFRSRPEVLDSVNEICSRLMIKEMGGIKYDEKNALYLGRECGEREERFKTELNIVETGDIRNFFFKGGKFTKEEAEAMLISERIKSLIKEGYEYKDIVILARSPGSYADIMLSVFDSEGIPAYAISNKGYFDAVEIETILSFLSIIDNPRQDIALAAVMHSAIYNFTDSELAEIVAIEGSLIRHFPYEEELVNLDALNAIENEENEDAPFSDSINMDFSFDTEKLKEDYIAFPKLKLENPELHEKLINFYKDLDKYRELSSCLSIHELLYNIYSKSSYYDYVSTMPAGRKRRENLNALIDKALEFERTNYRNLFDFIRYIEKLKNYESDEGEAGVYSEQDNLVRIMSIHKSKGLQFKVVIYAGVSRKFNKQDLRNKFLIDEELGIACDYMDNEGMQKLEPLKKKAVKRKLLREQLAEELRIMYVAMTRACDKLIITAETKDFTKDFVKYSKYIDTPNAVDISNVISVYDWILMSLLYNVESPDELYHGNERGVYRPKTWIELYKLSDILDKTLEDMEESGKIAGRITKELILDSARNMGDGCILNPYKEKSNDFIDEDFKNDAEISKEAKEEKLLRLSFNYAHKEATEVYPKFFVSEIVNKDKEAFISLNHSDELENKEKIEDALTKNGGMDRGNAYHRVFEFYDYTRGLEQILEYLNDEQMKLIDISDFENFLKTDLAKTFKEKYMEGKLFREQHFMRSVPYNYLFSESSVEDKVLLQGIMDAFYEDEGEFVLVDYKTDRCFKEEILIDRYREQLKLYREALKSITGKNVKSTYIYSVTMGKAIKVF